MALLLLVAPPVFMLLFFSGMAVTISEVSQKQNSKLWLDSHRGSCTLSVGIHLLQPSQSTQLVDMKGDEGWSALPWKIGLWIWPEVLTFYLKLSSHPQRTPQNVSHSLHMVQPGHQTSEGLLAPGLNSAGCLQMAFSKTRGRLSYNMVFGWGERKWNETAQLSLSIGLRPWISFPSEGVAASLRGNSLRFGGRVGRCIFIWRDLGRS